MQQIYLALMLFYTFQVEERMDIDKFSAHGEVHAHFQAEQNILHIDLVGPFNLEFMQKYERVVGAQRKNIDTPCWGSLVNVHGLALAPMEATNAGQEIEFGNMLSEPNLFDAMPLQAMSTHVNIIK